MTNTDKQRIALAQLEEHAEKYGTKIHERVLKLWKTGEIFKYDNKCLPPGTKQVMDTRSMRICVTPPAWEAHSTIGGVNPDVVDPGGEWKHAGSFIPLFELLTGLIVVRVDQPECGVGCFSDTTWDSTIDGYQAGVWPLAPSLDAFLKSLVDLDTPEVDWNANEELWGAEDSEDGEAD